MAFSFKAGTISEKSTTGSQAYTGVGFQPKAVMFMISSTDFDMIYGYGFATGPTAESAFGYFSEDAVGTSDTSRVTKSGDACIVGCNETTVFSQADFTSFDADGFTLNWSTVTGSSIAINYFAFGGTDLTNAAHLAFDSPASTGSQGYTGVGFQPDFAIFAGAANTSSEISSGVTGGNILVFGAAASSTSRFALGVSSQDGQGISNSNRQMVTDSCIIMPWAGNGAQLEEADFTSFDSDGFTLNWGTVLGDNRRYAALCFKGGQYAIGTDTQKTSAGTKATTGVGFQPDGLILSSVNNTSSASIVDTARVSNGGANSATSRCSHWGGDTDNAGTSIADRVGSTSSVLTAYTEGTPTLDAAADLDSFDSDGFTLDWTTADATAREFAYIAFGSAGGGGATNPKGVFGLALDGPFRRAVI